MSGRLIEEDLFTKYSIIDSRLPEGQRIHDFLAARAKALADKYIDFEKTPVTFVLSDSDEPNAFFVAATNQQERPKRDDYQTIRFIKNPLTTPVICVTRGLIEIVDNLDQLDFVLGHELTHMIMRGYGIERNSKGEEELADIHAVDLVYDAGGDPKQALLMSEKLNAYSEGQEEKRYSRDREEGVEWSRILDVHMTNGNRKAGIEASLTRLSHLIDDRQPTNIDNSVFDVSYDDPVDTFLKASNYETAKPVGKLKILVDCIEHISTYIPAKKYFRAKFNFLSQEELDDHGNFEYHDYFHGPVIEKKYQQKIANLAEDIIAKAEQERDRRQNSYRRNVINAQDLNIYLQNKAYQHILAHGYPKKSDGNYKDAAGILYSYFYYLFASYPARDKNGWDVPDKSPAQIEMDISATKQKIRTAANAEEFTFAIDELNKLKNILRDIRTIENSHYGEDSKLDNLSSFRGRNHFFKDTDPLYGDLNGGKVVPWNNLVAIAKSNPQIKEYIVKFLKENRVEDFRITHDLPYVRIQNTDCYHVSNDGIVSDQKIPEYELDFIIHRDDVLQVYTYIKTYFENEGSLIEKICEEIATIDEQGFEIFEKTSDMFNGNSVARKAVYSFMALFNTLPNEESDERYRSSNAISLIPDPHKKDHPIPASKEVESVFSERITFEFDEELLSFKNPIFKEYFGDNFEQEVLEVKKDQQQRMFDVSFNLLGKIVNIWSKAKDKLEELREKEKRLWDDIRKSIDGKDEETKEDEQESLRREIGICSTKEDQTSTFIYNILFSVFERNRHWYNLQRLTPEQKKVFAEFAVRDETGAIQKLFKAGHYSFFCDYLGILKKQTEQVIAGNYKLTEWMQMVADKFGYRHAITKDELKVFVDAHHGNRYGGDSQQYSWYLHIFDTMKYLEQTPNIDVKSLVTALMHIEEKEAHYNRDDFHDIVIMRCRNYKKLIDESNIFSLVARAINHQDNYKDLSCEELLQTADAFISMKDRMEKIFEREEKKDKAIEQRRFLKTVDKNIKTILRKAEGKALQNDNALERMVSLYKIYHQEDGRYSSDGKRSHYLNEMDKKESRLQKISALSKNESFWPENVLDHIKAFVFAKETFLDDKELEDGMLNDILAKLENLPSSKKKNECLFILLDQNLRAAYPQTRDRLFTIYTNDIYQKLGYDDGSKTYQKRLAIYLKGLEQSSEKEWDIGKQHGWQGLLSNSMSLADKYLLLRRLSDSILSQEKASQMIKESCQIKLNSNDMVKSYLYGVGVDYLTEKMDRDSKMANQFIQFLNSNGEQKDCEEISSFIEIVMKKECLKEILDEALRNTKPSNCKILYENFWSAPLEARAVIIARMLKSAVNDQENNEQHSWEQVFDLVMDTIIRPDDDSVEAKYARDIMHSYIKSRSDYERELIMSAMMVANRNIGNDAGNIGKALKLFLENMGPAEIKLGQAISSHPNTPENIKIELQQLKSAADMPARWTLYSWIRTENIPEELWKDKYLGEILGSASYYTTVALGEDKVLRILRPEAREKAQKGFKVIISTVDDLKEKEPTSDLSYQELTSSVHEMVIQAAKMSDTETDHEAGQQQYEHARNIYDSVTISCGENIFPLKVMDWSAKGKNWIIMDRAEGVTFNSLPEETSEQIEYKKSFAKAYITFEVINILLGKKFDHDRHGAQLSIDTLTNAVGIYDTGAMALHDPTVEDQRQLGNIIYDVFKSVMSGNEAFVSFSHIIGEKIDEIHQNDMDTQYLVEVKKGLLALGDFFKILTSEDTKDILSSINLSTDISEFVQSGMIEKMSMFEKEQYKALLTMQPSQRSSIVIDRSNAVSMGYRNVDNIITLPITQSKSSWLYNAFSDPSANGEEIQSAPPSEHQEPHNARFRAMIA